MLHADSKCSAFVRSQTGANHDIAKSSARCDGLWQQRRDGSRRHDDARVRNPGPIEALYQLSRRSPVEFGPARMARDPADDGLWSYAQAAQLVEAQIIGALGEPATLLVDDQWHVSPLGLSDS